MMGDCGRSLLLEPVLSSAVIATAALSRFADETPAELQGRHPSGKLDDVFRQLTMEAA